MTTIITKIWIEPTGKTLRLVWYYQGQRVRLSLGVPDSPVGRALANQKITEIQLDIAAGYYDTTLLKYRPRTLGKNPTEIGAVDLFEKYAKATIKDKDLVPGSTIRYTVIASKLKRFLGDKLAEKVTDVDAIDVVVLWSESASTQTVKSYLYLLRACWEWAKGKYHTTDTNPWDIALDRVRKKGNNRHKEEVKPFTIAELQTIIAAFTTHPQYRHYTDFITFLANTGCRFGEAVGLRWKHVNVDFSTVWIGESISRGHQNAKGTKTGKARTIQLPASAQSMLKARFDAIQHQPDNLVFPSPKGLPIDDHNFNRRAWKTILASCNIEYRSPYKLRHSAISHALDRGVNPLVPKNRLG